MDFKYIYLACLVASAFNCFSMEEVLEQYPAEHSDHEERIRREKELKDRMQWEHASAQKMGWNLEQCIKHSYDLVFFEIDLIDDRDFWYRQCAQNEIEALSAIELPLFEARLEAIFRDKAEQWKKEREQPFKFIKFINEDVTYPLNPKSTIGIEGVTNPTQCASISYHKIPIEFMNQQTK